MSPSPRQRHSQGDVILIETLLFAASMLAAVQAEVDKCTALEQDSARLACYDALFRPAPGPAALEAPAPTPVSRAPGVDAVAAPAAGAAAATEQPEDTFGLTEEQRAERAKVETLDEISAVIVGIEPSRVGKPVLVLDNGQRWKQLEATVLPVFGEGETVMIRKATFGSYLASVPESGRSAVRVRRLD